jgi:hypothetical protein
MAALTPSTPAAFTSRVASDEIDTFVAARSWQTADDPAAPEAAADIAADGALDVVALPGAVDAVDAAQPAMAKTSATATPAIRMP